MYKTFRVRHFRGLHDLTISPLERMNLIAGKNGVGKTALLEALRLYQFFDEPLTAVTVTRSRGLPWKVGSDFLFDLFENFDRTKAIELTARDVTHRDRLLRIDVQKAVRSLLAPAESDEENAPFLDSTASDMQERPELIVTFERKGPGRKITRTKARVTAMSASSFGRDRNKERSGAVFLSDIARHDVDRMSRGLSRLIELKRDESVLGVMKIMEPSLQALQVLSTGVYADTGMDRLLPIQLLGDGFTRLLRIIIEIPQVQGGLLLIDEIENGIHYSTQHRLWEEVAALCRQHDVQLFATTHSEECVRYAHEYFAKTHQYDFRLHRLERTDQTVKAITFNKEQLQTAFETGWEFR